MLEIKAYTPEIGAGVDEDGNVLLHAIDRNAGLVMTIKIESAYWDKAMENFSRLKGVGIVRANRLIPVPNIQDGKE